MRRDPLAALARLRRHELKLAQRALASALNAEAEAEASAGRADERLAREAAASWGEAGTPDAFAAWYPVGSSARRDALAAHARAMGGSGAAREHVAAARAALEIVGKVGRRREQERAAAAAAREQAASDEMAGHLFRRRSPGPNG